MLAREKGKRIDILKAATEVFSSKHYHATNIIDIADKAGIGKGTIYEYFESKEQMFVEVVKFNGEEYIFGLRQKLDDGESFADKINAFIRYHYSVILNAFPNTDILYRNFVRYPEISDAKEEIVEFLVNVRNDIKNILSDILYLGQGEGIIKDTDIDFAADIFFGMVVQFCFRGVMAKPTDKKIEDESSKLIDLLMSGIGNSIYI